MLSRDSRLGGEVRDQPPAAVNRLAELSDFGVPMIDLDADELAEDIANAWCLAKSATKCWPTAERCSVRRSSLPLTESIDERNPS